MSLNIFFRRIRANCKIYMKLGRSVSEKISNVYVYFCVKGRLIVSDHHRLGLLVTLEASRFIPDAASTQAFKKKRLFKLTNPL